MPSRRSILAATVAMVGAGCSNWGEADIDPADHASDGWHNEPKRGLADAITMSASELSQRPKSDRPILAAGTVAEVIEERLDDPENVIGGGCCQEVEGHDRATVLERLVILNRDGEVDSSPNIEFQTVREAIPRTVKAPDDSDHDCQQPMYVVDSMEQMD